MTRSPARTHSQFEAAPGGLVLSSAILLYRTEGAAIREGSAFASIHPIEQREGRPEIGAGAPLSRAHLRHWTAALGRTAALEILPANVLAAHTDLLAWWTPAQVRDAWFALSNPPEGLTALGSRVVLPVPYPAHLFIATGTALWVLALPESERPTADTPLLFSPILNVFSNGTLCWGNIARPKRLTVPAIPDFERAVFDSWSTHPNPGQERTIVGRRGKSGGLVRLWDDLAARRARRFPIKRLKPFGGHTLGTLIAELAR